MNALEKQFVELARDIHHKGMLDFETTCEKIVMEMPLPMVERKMIQEILDKAQEICNKEEAE